MIGRRMKKLFNVVLFLSVVFFLEMDGFASCKCKIKPGRSGPVGAIGPAGQAGADGTTGPQGAPGASGGNTSFAVAYVPGVAGTPSQTITLTNSIIWTNLITPIIGTAITYSSGHFTLHETGFYLVTYSVRPTSSTESNFKPFLGATQITQGSIHVATSVNSFATLSTAFIVQNTSADSILNIYASPSITLDNLTGSPLAEISIMKLSN